MIYNHVLCVSSLRAQVAFPRRTSIASCTAPSGVHEIFFVHSFPGRRFFEKTAVQFGLIGECLTRGIVVALGCAFFPRFALDFLDLVSNENTEILKLL